jgi:hypothetical protein
MVGVYDFGRGHPFCLMWLMIDLLAALNHSVSSSKDI